MFECRIFCLCVLFLAFGTKALTSVEESGKNITVVETENLDGKVGLSTLDVLPVTTEAITTVTEESTTERHMKHAPYTRWKKKTFRSVNNVPIPAHSPEVVHVNKSASTTEKGSSKSVNGSALTDVSESNVTKDLSNGTFTDGDERYPKTHHSKDSISHHQTSGSRHHERHHFVPLSHILMKEELFKINGTEVSSKNISEPHHRKSPPKHSFVPEHRERRVLKHIYKRPHISNSTTNHTKIDVQEERTNSSVVLVNGPESQDEQKLLSHVPQGTFYHNFNRLNTYRDHRIPHAINSSLYQTQDNISRVNETSLAENASNINNDQVDLLKSTSDNRTQHIPYSPNQRFRHHYPINHEYANKENITLQSNSSKQNETNVAENASNINNDQVDLLKSTSDSRTQHIPYSRNQRFRHHYPINHEYANKENITVQSNSSKQNETSLAENASNINNDQVDLLKSTSDNRTQHIPYSRNQRFRHHYINHEYANKENITVQSNSSKQNLAASHNFNDHHFQNHHINQSFIRGNVSRKNRTQNRYHHEKISDNHEVSVGDTSSDQDLKKSDSLESSQHYSTKQESDMIVKNIVNGNKEDSKLGVLIPVINIDIGTDHKDDSVSHKDQSKPNPLDDYELHLTDSIRKDVSQDNHVQATTEMDLFTNTDAGVDESLFDLDGNTEKELSNLGRNIEQQEQRLQILKVKNLFEHLGETTSNPSPGESWSATMKPIEESTITETVISIINTEASEHGYITKATTTLPFIENAHVTSIIDPETSNGRSTINDDIIQTTKVPINIDDNVNFNVADTESFENISKENNGSAEITTVSLITYNNKDEILIGVPGSTEIMNSRRYNTTETTVTMPIEENDKNIIDTESSENISKEYNAPPETTTVSLIVNHNKVETILNIEKSNTEVDYITETTIMSLPIEENVKNIIAAESSENITEGNYAPAETTTVLLINIHNKNETQVADTELYEKDKTEKDDLTESTTVLMPIEVTETTTTSLIIDQDENETEHNKTSNNDAESYENISKAYNSAPETTTVSLIINHNKFETIVDIEKVNTEVDDIIGTTIMPLPIEENVKNIIATESSENITEENYAPAETTTVLLINNYNKNETQFEGTDLHETDNTEKYDFTETITILMPIEITETTATSLIIDHDENETEHTKTSNNDDESYENISKAYNAAVETTTVSLIINHNKIETYIADTESFAKVNTEVDDTNETTTMPMPIEENMKNIIETESFENITEEKDVPVETTAVSPINNHNKNETQIAATELYETNHSQKYDITETTTISMPIEITEITTSPIINQNENETEHDNDAESYENISTENYTTDETTSFVNDNAVETTIIERNLFETTTTENDGTTETTIISLFTDAITQNDFLSDEQPTQIKININSDKAGIKKVDINKVGSENNTLSKPVLIAKQNIHDGHSSFEITKATENILVATENNIIGNSANNNEFKNKVQQLNVTSELTAFRNHKKKLTVGPIDNKEKNVTNPSISMILAISDEENELKTITTEIAMIEKVTKDLYMKIFPSNNNEKIARTITLPEFMSEYQNIKPVTEKIKNTIDSNLAAESSKEKKTSNLDIRENVIGIPKLSKNGTVIDFSKSITAKPEVDLSMVRSSSSEILEVIVKSATGKTEGKVLELKENINLGPTSITEIGNKDDSGIIFEKIDDQVQNFTLVPSFIQTQGNTKIQRNITEKSRNVIAEEHPSEANNHKKIMDSSISENLPYDEAQIILPNIGQRDKVIVSPQLVKKEEEEAFTENMNQMHNSSIEPLKSVVKNNSGMHVNHQSTKNTILGGKKYSEVISEGHYGIGVTDSSTPEKFPIMETATVIVINETKLNQVQYSSSVPENQFLPKLPNNETNENKQEIVTENKNNLGTISNKMGLNPTSEILSVNNSLIVTNNINAKERPVSDGSAVGLSQHTEINSKTLSDAKEQTLFSVTDSINLSTVATVDNVLLENGSGSKKKINQSIKKGRKLVKEDDYIKSIVQNMNNTTEPYDESESSNKKIQTESSFQSIPNDRTDTPTKNANTSEEVILETSVRHKINKILLSNGITPEILEEDKNIEADTKRLSQLIKNMSTQINKIMNEVSSKRYQSEDREATTIVPVDFAEDLELNNYNDDVGSIDEKLKVSEEEAYSCQYIRRTILGNFANLTISIVVRDITYCIPPNVWIVENMQNNTMNFTWNSETDNMNNSFTLNLTHISNYLISGAQLSLIRDRHVFTWKKYDVSLPHKKDSTQVTLVFDDDVYVYLSNVDFLRTETTEEHIRADISESSMGNSYQSGIAIGFLVVIVLFVLIFLSHLTIRIKKKRKNSKNITTSPL